MNRTLSVTLSVFCMAAISLLNLACIGGSSETTEEIKPMSAYYEEADKTITADNADAELAKIMKEIDADTE